MKGYKVEEFEYDSDEYIIYKEGFYVDTEIKEKSQLIYLVDEEDFERVKIERPRNDEYFRLWVDDNYVSDYYGLSRACYDAFLIIETRDKLLNSYHAVFEKTDQDDVLGLYSKQNLVQELYTHVFYEYYGCVEPITANDFSECRLEQWFIDSIHTSHIVTINAYPKLELVELNYKEVLGILESEIGLRERINDYIDEYFT